MQTYFKCELTTPGWSLNMVVAHPYIFKELKKFCEDNKCHPIDIAQAMYNFVRIDRFAKTYYQVIINVADGRGKVPAQWMKDAKFKWVFGDSADGDIAREV